MTERIVSEAFFDGRVKSSLAETNPKYGGLVDPAEVAAICATGDFVYLRGGAKVYIGFRNKQEALEWLEKALGEKTSTWQTAETRSASGFTGTYCLECGGSGRRLTARPSSD